VSDELVSVLKKALNALAAEHAVQGPEFLADEMDLRVALGALVRIIHRRRKPTGGYTHGKRSDLQKSTSE
jgi:hypothetical protein